MKKKKFLHLIKYSHQLYILNVELDGCTIQKFKNTDSLQRFLH